MVQRIQLILYSAVLATYAIIQWKFIRRNIPVSAAKLEKDLDTFLDSPSAELFKNLTCVLVDFLILPFLSWLNWVIIGMGCLMVISWPEEPLSAVLFVFYFLSVTPLICLVFSLALAINKKGDMI